MSLGQSPKLTQLWFSYLQSSHQQQHLLSSYCLPNMVGKLPSQGQRLFPPDNDTPWPRQSLLENQEVCTHSLEWSPQIMSMIPSKMDIQKGRKTSGRTGNVTHRQCSASPGSHTKPCGTCFCPRVVILLPEVSIVLAY